VKFLFRFFFSFFFWVLRADRRGGKAVCSPSSLGFFFLFFHLAWFGRYCDGRRSSLSLFFFLLIFLFSSPKESAQAAHAREDLFFFPRHFFFAGKLG